MAITRRVFLRNGAMAVAGTAAAASFLTRAACGMNSIGNKRLVVIFQRGAADGLNIVIPHAESAYYAMRPSISIPQKAVLDLDGFFGLHPAMASLQPLWTQKHLAIVHATGSPAPTRLHFDAQGFMESGTPQVKVTRDGWLNRTLRSLPQPDTKIAFRAIALGPSMPHILHGPERAFAMSILSGFEVDGCKPSSNRAFRTLEATHADSVDYLLHGTERETSTAVKTVNSADPTKYKHADGADYPAGHFGEGLKHLARLIKADLGVQVAFVDIGGWDHHENQGACEGQLANLLQEFSQSLSAFWIDLGDEAGDTVIVTMSEFGRTARENENRGTDHGHANVMLVMGGPVKGGKVYGRWPGLDQSQLHQGRDLAVTTDFRTILGELVHLHLGNSSLHQVFPGFANSRKDFLGIL